MDKEMKEIFVKQMLLPKEELALQTMELMADKMDLQQKIEKAVEYIENNTKYFDKEYCSIYGELCSMPGANNTRLHVVIDVENLLNILKGDDTND